MSQVESPEEIGSIWRMLENRADLNREEIEVYRTRTPVEKGRAALGLDRRGNRHVLVPVCGDSEVSPDRRSGGVHLLTRVLRDRGQDVRFIDLVCVKPHLDNVFSVFAGELLERLEEEDDEPVEIRVRQVLEDWRELFARDRGETLGRGGLAGLFGELWHLNKLCGRSPSALESWSGPLGARHDFRSAGCALEVKTTLRRHGRIVEIHGHRQLEPPADGDLYLAFVQLEEAEVGVSVPDLVQEIRKTGLDRAEFLKRLSEAGYDSSDEAAYREYEFHMNETLLYHVGDDFPRIVPESFSRGEIPPGVLSISYTIDLTGPEPQPMSGEEVSAVYGRLASGEIP